MGRDRAAYMREYRARKAQEVLAAVGIEMDTGSIQTILGQSRRIAELEEEVQRLKRELAQRPEFVREGDRVAVRAPFQDWSSLPARPVPKKGK